MQGNALNWNRILKVLDTLRLRLSRVYDIATISSASGMQSTGVALNQYMYLARSIEGSSDCIKRTRQVTDKAKL